MRNGEFHILVNVRDKNFNLIEEFTCSGDEAVLDVMKHLDEKYNPSPIAFIKKFW